MDASGRYRGQLFFGNDFWVGSKQFCFEINKETQTLGHGTKAPVLKFFIAQILFNVTMPVEQVCDCLTDNFVMQSMQNQKIKKY